MTFREMVRLAVVVAVLALSVAWAGEGRGARPLPAASSPSAEAAQILAAWNEPDVGQRIDELGGRLAVEAKDAEPLLAQLASDASIEAAMLRGELLVWIARGEKPGQKRGAKSKGEPPPRIMPTERLGELAGELLGHPDPIVRGLAEWAIALRLGLECEGRIAKPWHQADGPEWYRRWLALDGEALLDCDYVRQAVALGQHRTGNDLAESMAAVAKRLARLREWSLPRLDPARAPAIDAAIDRFAAAKERLVRCTADRPGDLAAQHEAWLAARRAAREVVLCSPDLNFGEILFATRTGPDSGNITNGSLRDAYGPGSEICVKSGFAPSGATRPLLAGRLGPGHLRGLDLHWDAERMVFSYVKQPHYDSTKDAVMENTEKGRSEPAHLYEIGVDGSGLRQLTDLPYNSDVEPCYLPDGDLVFVSDRSNYGSQCSGMLGQDKMITNLYRCDAHGGSVRWLSNNKDFDRYPHMMQNGQVLFVHWEYQERHLWQTHTLWTCRPDGSMTDALYKQHIEGGPMSLREARQIPGQRQLVAIACGHHNGEIGAVMLVDYSKGVNNPEGMRMLTPGVSGTEGGYGRRPPVEEGGVADGGGHYQFPYPLSDKSFLAAYSYKRPEKSQARNFGLYYIDVWGNKELIHRDRFLSVIYPRPLCKTPRPPVLPDAPQAPEAGRHEATVVMTDANYGLASDAPKVRYLRIAQKLPWPCVRDAEKPWGYNHLHATPTGAWTPLLGSWDWSPARVIGTVPVESDGSAHFLVPVDQPLYFQALDENYLEVRRMRSNVTFRPGEMRSCVGCHETKTSTPLGDARPRTLALSRPASMPLPPAWGCADPPNYDRDIQPIFDRHCTRCHSPNAASALRAKPDLSGRRVGDYAQSYRSLFGIAADLPTPVSSEDAWKWLHPGEPAPTFDREFFKLAAKNAAPGQLVSISDRFGGAEVTPERAFGSSQSKLVLTLLEDKRHRDEVHLPRQDWIALVTWVDLNAPYFDTYADKAPTADGQPARWVRVRFPNPWAGPPAGEWIWGDDGTVIVKP